MKHLRKCVSIILTALMLLSVMSNALAAGTAVIAEDEPTTSSLQNIVTYNGPYCSVAEDMLPVELTALRVADLIDGSTQLNPNDGDDTDTLFNHLKALSSKSGATQISGLTDLAVAWKFSYSSDSYNVVDGGISGTIDLSAYAGSYKTLTMVIGNDPLPSNPENVIYNVSLTLGNAAPSADSLFDFRYVKADGTEVTEADFLEEYSTTMWGDETIYLTAPRGVDIGNLRLLMETSADNSGIDTELFNIDVYNGYYSDVSELKGSSRVTGAIGLNGTGNLTSSSGVLYEPVDIDDDSEVDGMPLTAVITRKTTDDAAYAAQLIPFYVIASSTPGDFYVSGIYAVEDDPVNEGEYVITSESAFYTYSSYDYEDDDGTYYAYAGLKYGYFADEPYAVKLTYQDDVEQKTVLAAFVDEDNEITELTEDRTDSIADALFDEGYIANYAEGLNLTVFVGNVDSEGVETNVERYTVTVTLNEAENKGSIYLREIDGEDYYTYLGEDSEYDEDYDEDSEIRIALNYGVTLNGSHAISLGFYHPRADSTKDYGSEYIDAVYVGSVSEEQIELLTDDDPNNDPQVTALTDEEIGNLFSGTGYNVEFTETDNVVELTIVDTMHHEPYNVMFKVTSSRSRVYVSEFTKADGSGIVWNYADTDLDEETQVLTVYVPNGTLVSQQFTVRLGMSYIGDLSKVKAYAGTLTASQAASAKDISDALFETGYTAKFNGAGQSFTIIGLTGDLYHVTVAVRASTSVTPQSAGAAKSADTYFRVTGATQTVNGVVHQINSWYIDAADDNYYYNGYQTVFLDGDDIQFTDGKAEISISHDTPGYKATIYHNDGNKNKVNERVSASVYKDEEIFEVKSTDTVIGPVQYSAAAENGTCLKNYWITYVIVPHAEYEQLVPGSATSSAGGNGELFINGVTNLDEVHKDNGEYQRVVVFDSSEHGAVHDIFVANVGSGDITDLKVTLTDAKGVKLDDYWNDQTSGTLSAGMWFDDSYGAVHNQNSITKIRLVPDTSTSDDGTISGTLTISGGGKSYTIKLIGYNNFGLATGSLDEAVLYVPYDKLIQNNSMAASNAVKYTVSPESVLTGIGLELYDNGVIYGVPTSTGTYTFTISASIDLGLDMPDATSSASRTFKLVVKDNGDDNVWAKTDDADGYSINIAIPNQDGSTDNINTPSGKNQSATVSGTMNNGTYVDNDWSDSTLVMYLRDAPFARFRNVYLDGEMLTEGTDYKAGEGSTTLTITTQSLRKSSGTHTLAVEWYDTAGNDGTMKKASQNYSVSRPSTSESSGRDGNSPEPEPEPEPQPVTYNITATAGAGGTVSTSATTAEAGTVITVTVAPDEGYVVRGATATGVTLTNHYDKTYTFTMPAQDVTVSVTFDVRPDTGFDDVFDDDWFADAVIYVHEKGIMDGVGNSLFAPYMSCNRAMLVTTLYRLEGSPTVGATGMFTDLEPGSYYEDAVNWAASEGIVYGMGDGLYMPDGELTREQMAAIIYRYSAYKGYDMTAENDLARYEDASAISDWALEAIKWCNNVGLIQGISATELDPAGVTNRAQIATVLMRVDQYKAEVTENEPNDATQDDAQ